MALSKFMILNLEWKGGRWKDGRMEEWKRGMSIIGEVIVTINVNFGISYALNSSRHSPSAVSYEKR